MDSPSRRPRLRPLNPWGEELAPEVPVEERTSGGSGRRLRPLSAPAGGAVAVCPHCWGLNPGGKRLCGRCGADMTLVLQESGGLRRTAPVQSPVPVRVAGRLGVGARAVLLVMTALLALAWVAAPLVGGGRAIARKHNLTRGHGDTATRGAGRPQARGYPRVPASDASVAPMQRTAVAASPRLRVPVSAGRRIAPSRS